MFYNLGTGRPTSNREVIRAVEKVTGKKINLTKADSGEGTHKGHHHFIDLGLVAEVEGQKVRLSANADVAVTMEEEKA